MDHKVIFMKDLADKWNLKPAKNFSRSEQYLEYAIEEINKRSTKYRFCQYLYLIDKLYVVLVKKDSVVGYERGPRPDYMQKVAEQGYGTGVVDPDSGMTEKLPPSPLEENQSGLYGMDQVKDEDFVKKNLKETKLPWQK